jgi:DNA polymerase-1
MDRNNGRCDCPLRERAKVFGHGFSYGLGAKGMAAQHDVEIQVALEFVQGMTDAFPELAGWKHEVRQMAGVLDYGEEAPEGDTYRILRNAYGRRMRVERSRAYTQATAMMGQGGTRDVMAEALLRMPFWLRRRVKVVIHDEIVLSLPAGDGVAEWAQRLADGMAFDFNGVPVTFGCSRPALSLAGCYGAQYGN